jgi:hypothetical protein
VTACGRRFVLGWLLVGVLAGALPCHAAALPGGGRPGDRAAAPAPDRAAVPSAHRVDPGVIGLSLLVPGAAHLRMGESGRAAAFFASEAAIWVAWGVFRVQGTQRHDSYVEMAELWAGVAQASGRSDSYYRLLGNWSSSGAYDQLIRREARDLYPDDLEARAAYVEAHRTPADRAWRWQTQAAWDRYRAKRNDSRQAFRSARMMLGLAVANRVVAMVDASLLARRGAHDTGLRLEAGPGPRPGSATVGLSLRLP